MTIKNRITLKQLEAFVSVVDTGSFRSAANALGTTQPNISARIAALEAALGTTLLFRDAGSVRLSDSGTSLLHRSREVLWSCEKLLEEAGQRHLMEDRLRLGVTELVACTWLQPFLRRLRQDYPKLRVDLQVDLAMRIEDQLKSGALDLALQSGPVTADLAGSMPLGEEAYIWAAAPDMVHALGPDPSLQQVFAQSVVTHAKHTQAGLALHEMARTYGFDAGQIVHSSALSACVPMVCEGLGVGLLPRALIVKELASGALRSFDMPWLPEPLPFFARFDPGRTSRLVGRIAQIAVDVAGHSKMPQG